MQSPYRVKEGKYIYELCFENKVFIFVWNGLSIDFILINDMKGFGIKNFRSFDSDGIYLDDLKKINIIV